MLDSGASGSTRATVQAMEDDGLAADFRSAASQLLQPWVIDGGCAGAIAALALWIPAHVSNHLALGRGRPTSWRWGLMTIAWVMEQCGIHTFVGNG